MKLFRSVLFWCHLVVGLVVAVVVVIMSATGVALTYQKQMTVWADTRGLDGTAPQPGASRIPVDSLLRGVQRATSVTPTAVTVRSGADAPVEVTLGRDRRVFVNAYTGAVLGEGSPKMRGFFRSMTAWHRTLGATGERRTLGKAITGVANLGFLFLVVSGLYLWFPRNWSRRAFMSVLTFRRGLSAKARDFNWHNVIGVWSVAPLAIIVASGVVISYGWAGTLVYRIMGEKPPAPQQAAAAPASAGRAPTDSTISFDGIDAMLAQASAKIPAWRTITFTLPRASAKTVAFSLDAGMGGQPQARATLTLNRASGSETKFEEFSAQSPGRRLRSILRFAHTGEVLGVVGQTIAGLLSLGAVVLAYTGIMLALRRLGAWRGRRGRREEIAETERAARAA
jgi:uncharacterized iron-regulated membrane protein